MIPYTNLFKKPQNRVIHAAAVKLEKNKLHLDREVDGSSTIDFNFAVSWISMCGKKESFYADHIFTTIDHCIR